MDDLLFRDVPVEIRSSPFAKEPAPARGKVFRGVLKFGGGPGNAIPFLWQPGAKKLFLDLNRNRDLTGGAGGAFSGRPVGPQFAMVNHQLFTNIHLCFPATSAGAPMQVDFNCFQYGESPPQVNVMERSYWRGKWTVAGQEWEVGLVQNMSDQPGSFKRGQLLLRPWEEHDQTFSGWSGSLDTYAIPFDGRNKVLKAAEAFEFSPTVFFQDHAWRLDWNAEPQGSGEKLALRFTEEQPALGELKITGRFVQRLVLTGGPYVVVLVRPAGSVKIPVGSYNQPSVWLKQGQAEAYFDSVPKSGKRTVPEPTTGGIRPVSGVEEAWKVVVVDQRKPAVLTMGGPLTNSFSVTRHGRDLNLTYRLIGEGGGDYILWTYAAPKGGGSPPQFAIYNGEKKIAADKFEFG